MLCVIEYRQVFFRMDEIITHVTPPVWPPAKNTLGYIAGGGRIVFGIKNKKLKAADVPAYQTAELTPPGFPDLDSA
ncbi:hypothetical protein D0466_19935 [Peribacillus glennii]|uniref:Uncharacterized protein n=2 Tax=Peribacillus glennii TaxID=2303991 RepID=A0A372L6U2_9BACI|nr:hypothetical protein D0466_19935 [Peribacillus glennii]